MKRLTLLTLCGLLFFSSCSKKDNLSIAENANINEDAIMQVQKSTNLDEQKSMYRLLNPTEKATVWQRKFDAFLIDHNKLTTEEISFIKNLQKIITPELFSLRSKSNIAFDEKAIKENAIKLFGVSVAHTLLASVSDMPPTTNLNAPASCGCSKSSDYCDGMLKCQNAGCKEDSSGCGTLWLSSCDGNCQRVTIIIIP